MLSRQRELWKVFEQQPRDNIFEPTPNPLQFLEARPDRHQGYTIKEDTEKGGGWKSMGIPGGLYGGTIREMTPCPNQLNTNDLDERQAGRRCFVKA